MKHKRGFTLIELLVVISIIALLMAILMPALTKVREQAKDVVCKSNLRQWGIVFAGYNADNDGLYPRGWHGVTPGDGGAYIWAVALKPYYDDESLLICPSATKPYGTTVAFEKACWKFDKMDLDGSEPYRYMSGITGSYTVNHWLGQLPPGVTSNTDRYWKRSGQNGASNIPVLLEGPMWLARPHDTDRPPQYNGQNAWPEVNSGGIGEMARVTVQRHGKRAGTTNATMMDGSMRQVGLKELWTLRWHRKFNTKNRCTLAGGMKPRYWPDWMRDFKDY